MRGYGYGFSLSTMWLSITDDIRCGYH